MDDWTHGYDVSVGYTHSFYREMAPDWLDLCARLGGQAPPPGRNDEAFRYLELGCGQGTGLCLLAAANPAGEFVGIDFLPEHIAHARGLAEAAGLTNVRFEEGDFVALAARWPADLGAFEYVTLHGVYSWVSPAVRQAVVDCLRHATAPGGLVYNGYNAQPGWLGTMPFQHITRLIKETSEKPSPEVLNDSIDLFERLRAGGATTFKILPGLAARLTSMKQRSAGYLVGEYLHEHWHPLWHSEVAKEFAGADLNYVGSATLSDTLLPGVLPPSLRDTVLAQFDERLQQDILDLVINQFFRRDLFTRGHRPTSQTNIQGVSDTQLRRLSTPSGDLQVRTTFGEIALQGAAFAEVMEALQAGPRPIHDLVTIPGLRRQGQANAINILLLLLEAQALALAPVNPGDASPARSLNRVLARGAAQGAPYDFIAAPAVGSALQVTSTDLVILDAWLSHSPREDLDAQSLGQRLVGRLPEGATRSNNGSAPTAAQANEADLAAGFLQTTLPRWQALGAV